jgi:hypothetical protein
VLELLLLAEAVDAREEEGKSRRGAESQGRKGWMSLPTPLGLCVISHYTARGKLKSEENRVSKTHEALPRVPAWEFSLA